MRKNTEEFTEAEDKYILHIAYTMLGFVFLQSLLLPSSGVWGALIAGTCAIVPWLRKYFQANNSKIVSIVVTTLLLAPLWHLFCAMILLAALNTVGTQ